MTLAELPIGHIAIINQVGGEGALRRRLLDMGLTPKTRIAVRKVAPMGDPIELTVRGYELTLRIEDARRIEIQPLEEGLTLSAPGKGPERRCKSMSIIALMGNQNCGKTTLFNQLTGSKQHVGNFPGVTVDKKEGVVRKHENISVVDLPGIYSLSPYTSEEIVSRNFLLEEKPTPSSTSSMQPTLNATSI